VLRIAFASSAGHSKSSSSRKAPFELGDVEVADPVAAAAELQRLARVVHALIGASARLDCAAE
jgi:hypothetical protein